MSDALRVALVGNPNCGKTSLFNHLTGTRQKVANYAGVTVERKVGFPTRATRNASLMQVLLQVEFQFYRLQLFVTQNA